MFRVKEECPHARFLEIRFIEHRRTIQVDKWLARIFLSVMLSSYRHWILVSQQLRRDNRVLAGWYDFGSLSMCCLPQLPAPVLNSMSANPFLDLYFKWDQRSASGSCQWRLICYPDLPCSGSPKWLWPSLGFPRSTRCPYRSPQQGRDCVSVSHRVEHFSDFICVRDYPKRVRPLISANIFWASTMCHVLCQALQTRY